MLALNFLENVSVILYFYMFIYNLTLVGFFWLITSVVNSNLKTLYSFSNFSFDSFYLFFITVFLFSLAGVPPFIGFFSKVFLLNLIVNSSFFLLYSLLFIILLLGLYFYMQNLRFLHSTNMGQSLRPSLNEERVIITKNYFLLFLSIFLINGVFLIDDFIMLFFWLLL